LLKEAIQGRGTPPVQDQLKIFFVVNQQEGNAAYKKNKVRGKKP